MTPQELENRIKAGEDVRTELKNEHAHPDALAATIVSFANRPEGGSLIREGASKRTATRQELFELYQAAGSLHPDEMPIEDASIEDLDLVYLKKIRPDLAGRPPDEMCRILTNTRFLSKSGCPTLAGMVCFGREVTQFWPHAKITAIRVAGKNAGDALADRAEFTGVLQRQIQQAQKFVQKHIARAGRTKATPIYRFPFEAIDEAIVNAMAHRDYHAPAQVRLFIFDDRIEVISPGRLLNSITIEQMRYGCHAVRNRVIFEHLARLKLVIQAGMGIPRMIDLIRADGLPEPQIISTGLDMRVIFFLQG